MKVQPVAWTTGAESPNQTVARAKVGGADLGILWDDGRGGVLSMWGDTYADGPGQGTLWRSNTVARSTNRDYADRGVLLDRWVTETTDPHCAGEVIHRDGPADYTVIPTSGVCIRDRQYVTYMAVAQWVAGDRWTTNYAGYAWSDDGGVTWTKDPAARWDNTPAFDDPWQMCALTPGSDGYLYRFGTPNGRAGDCRLSRVPDDAVLDLGAYRYWTGQDWSEQATDAAVVIPAPVSELSVAFHSPSAQWLAGYYSPQLQAIVVHTAPAVTGPWSAPEVVAEAGDFPGLYGFFFHPWSMADSSPCASMSQWSEYETRLVRLELD